MNSLKRSTSFALIAETLAEISKFKYNRMNNYYGYEGTQYISEAWRGEIKKGKVQSNISLECCGSGSLRCFRRDLSHLRFDVYGILDQNPVDKKAKCDPYGVKEARHIASKITYGLHQGKLRNRRLASRSCHNFIPNIVTPSLFNWGYLLTTNSSQRSKSRKTTSSYGQRSWSGTCTHVSSSQLWSMCPIR